MKTLSTCYSLAGYERALVIIAFCTIMHYRSGPMPCSTTLLVAVLGGQEFAPLPQGHYAIEASFLEMYNEDLATAWPGARTMILYSQ